MSRTDACIQEAEIPAGPLHLPAELALPASAQGTILFAHGSAGSRHSRRHQHIAARLREAGFATLLFDLLSPEEEPPDTINRELRSNVHLLAARIRAATFWLREQPDCARLPLGYFGASTGAAAAIIAAAGEDTRVGALVTRSARTDLAGGALFRLRTPTLLLVGSEDALTLPLNLEAWTLLPTPKSLEVIPGASHLFLEPGALDMAAALAARWYAQHLRPRAG